MKDTVPDEKFHEFLMVAGRGIFIKPIGPPRAPSPEPAEAAPRDESAVSLDRARLILRIADERIRVDPKDADALFARASALASMGDLRGAVSSLDSLAADPKWEYLGGPLGTDVSKRLVSQAPGWLRPGGAIAIEIGEAWQGDVLPGAEVRDDHTGRARVVWKRF